MVVDAQTLINLGLGIILAGIGWWGRVVWDSLQKLKDDVHEIEIDLPKSYVSKDEFHDTMSRIEGMVQKIFDKLDGKMDK
ncbi:MAG: hypothetical protein AMJ84_03855 [Acidithiobacillales bacterium SM23_46]|nr:MAG: hypothetical protein AMJ84_03855 [Acidithiobacillales bacterium SM23_46]